MKLWTKRFKTNYWRPGTDYINEIIVKIKNNVKEGDIITVSEKALSTALGNLIDEANVKPRSLAKFLAVTWTRKMWGGPLGKLVKFKDKTLMSLRKYPIKEGAAHKQVTLKMVGLLQSLRHYSEGGIDASNLPYSYVCLPLPNPNEISKKIRMGVLENLNINVTVLIVDGDTTYSWRNLHLAPRKVSIPGLLHKGGFLPFLVGRLLGLKARRTPIGIAGEHLNPDRALWLAERFHKMCGAGAGRTVWSMAENMDTSLTGVTWEMLDRVDHFPIVIFRFI